MYFTLPTDTLTQVKSPVSWQQGLQGGGEQDAFGGGVVPQAQLDGYPWLACAVAQAVEAFVVVVSV